MKLYADTPSLRARQVLGDALALVWTAGWVLVGRWARDMIATLAGPAGSLRSTGKQLGDSMRSAASSVGEVPYIGDQLVAPFDTAAGTGDGIVRTSDQLVAQINQIAWWTGLLVAAVPIVLGLLWWCGKRLAFVRRASMTQRFVDADADLDLFALRAMANQPLERLDAVSHDPVGAWRARDLDVIRRLATMELADAGLRPPAPRPAEPVEPAEVVLRARDYRAAVAREQAQHEAPGTTSSEGPVREY